MPGITAAGLSDIGRKREDNEDAFGSHVPQDADVLARRGRLFVVADGMGGEAAGEIASRTAVEVTLRAYFEDPDATPADALARGIQRANAAIYEEARANPDRKGMGTTCTLIALRGGDAFIAHVGDSRAYLIRDDRILRLTRDHSLRERGPAFAHILTRAVGVRPTVEVDVLRVPIAIHDRDMLLMCTDGLWGTLDDPELLRIVTESPEPEAACKRLIERANEGGSDDNITAQLVRVQEPELQPPSWLRRAFRRVAVAATYDRLPWMTRKVGEA
jgi:serine/threonine protein phosphatase PrpC